MEVYIFEIIRHWHIHLFRVNERKKQNKINKYNKKQQYYKCLGCTAIKIVNTYTVMRIYGYYVYGTKLKIIYFIRF